ncbi:MAG: class I SAM-dependent methyltransferase, partial [Chloroflexota bacterium]
MKKATVRFEIRLDETESDQESQQAYDDIYTDSDISQTDSFYLWLMELLSLQAGERYLDISCGRAQLPRLAREIGVNAYGLDLSYAALRSGFYPSGLMTGNAQDLPYADESFDVVSNIGSLEHYLDMETAVSEMTRVLKKNGRAVVLLPNSF